MKLNSNNIYIPIFLITLLSMLDISQAISQEALNFRREQTPPGRVYKVLKVLETKLNKNAITNFELAIEQGIEEASSRGLDTLFLLSDTGFISDSLISEMQKFTRSEYGHIGFTHTFYSGLSYYFNYNSESIQYHLSRDESETNCGIRNDEFYATGIYTDDLADCMTSHFMVPIFDINFRRVKVDISDIPATDINSAAKKFLYKYDFEFIPRKIIKEAIVINKISHL